MLESAEAPAASSGSVHGRQRSRFKLHSDNDGPQLMQASGKPFALSAQTGLSVLQLDAAVATRIADARNVSEVTQCRKGIAAGPLVLNSYNS